MADWKTCWAALCLAASSSQAFALDGPYPSDATSVATGRELAEIHCAACHAVGEEDTSAQEGAPAFRDLSGLYPLESLEEALAEGIVTGHDNMPEFAFEPDDINAFLGYLTTIQSK
ncbi:c-type cytochrome [Roseibium salinum]|uniref:C-type cytochrome n=1 Tax=Roseibium salinum TaxID=1604349 RepID=A0ABT3QZ75_9HYPH|nr:c-type cytochrome [Roseibium sp. DSM 29163]MCX2722262.1 c-type cytochrome [Roseibium sp. DSM 29163]